MNLIAIFTNILGSGSSIQSEQPTTPEFQFLTESGGKLVQENGDNINLENQN